MRDAVRKSKGGGTFEDDDVWWIQGSRTADEYKYAMSALASKCPAAEVYLSTVDKRDWVNYAMWDEHEVHTLGLRTNQQVEAINGANVEIRKKSSVALVLNPDNKEEPVVDARVRRQRHNAGMNPWLDEGEWV
mmetsp:Transcript_17941/g.37308  ORF Transcript_17941/g.37308 Transcript_17941/m.37308 type:complete len:133 (+) Transcript_17941:1396-1794(+)